MNLLKVEDEFPNLYWDVPNGIKENLEKTRLETLVLTIGGFIFLSIVTFKKSQEEVKLHS